METKQNIDPAISAYIESYVREQLSSLADIAHTLKDNEAALSMLIEAKVELEKSISDINSNINSMGERVKKIIDDNLAQISEGTEIASNDLYDRIDKLETSMEASEKYQQHLYASFQRYIKKEKYDITRKLVADVIRQELEHG